MTTGQKSELVSLWIQSRVLYHLDVEVMRQSLATLGSFIVKTVMLEDATKPFLAIIFPLDKF